MPCGTLIRYVNNVARELLYVKYVEMPTNRSHPIKSSIDYACQSVTCYELRWIAELNAGINSVCKLIAARGRRKRKEKRTSYERSGNQNRRREDCKP